LLTAQTKADEERLGRLQALNRKELASQKTIAEKWLRFMTLALVGACDTKSSASLGEGKGEVEREEGKRDGSADGRLRSAVEALRLDCGLPPGPSTGTYGVGQQGSVVDQVDAEFLVDSLRRKLDAAGFPDSTATGPGTRSNRSKKAIKLKRDTLSGNKDFRQDILRAPVADVIKILRNNCWEALQELQVCKVCGSRSLSGC
jgi:hypothetical protein